MQILKVSSIVGAVHFGLAVLLIQPGCQSIDRAWEEHRAERGTVLAKEDDLFPASRPVESGLDEINEVSIPSTELVGSQALFRPTRPPEPPVRTPAGGTGGSGMNQFINAGVETPLAFGPDDNFGGPGRMGDGGGELYTVRSGDSLWTIAKREDIRFNDLLEANGMTRETKLRVGQSIILPAGPAEIVGTGSTAPGGRPAGWEAYTVRSGDSLSALAQRTGTTVAEIKGVNGLTSDVIRVGRPLFLPGGSSLAAGAPAGAARAQSAPGGSQSGPIDYSGKHTVVAGEYPQAIARLYGMTTTELLRVNNISDPTRLRVGTELKVRSTAGVDGAVGSRPAPRSKLGRTDGGPLVRGEDGVFEVEFDRPAETPEEDDLLDSAPVINPGAAPAEDDGFDIDDLDDIGIIVF
ncbi:MAG: LysM peptidoglycan-binding domain-containing protein [Puniceicoccaceae bacterium]